MTTTQMKSEAKICFKSFPLGKYTRMMSGGLNIVLDENFIQTQTVYTNLFLFIYILVPNEL